MNPIEFWKKHNLKNFVDRGGIISPDEIRHIEDWLKSEDGLTYHRQISKISVPNAIRLSNEWALKLIEQATDKELESDIEIVMTFNDGFFVVKLLTTQAYLREGKLMGHCVGSYDPESQNIYSLRDSLNQPHATIEVSFDNKIEQIQGKGNKPVVRKYHKYIQDFLVKNQKTELLSLTNSILSKIGLFKHKNEIYDLYQLEETDSDIERIMAFDNGLFVVKLLSTKIYKREGFLINKIIRYQSTNHQVYSLRDSSNKPVAVIEIMYNKINKVIVSNENKKYYKYVHDFLIKKLNELD